MPFTLTTLALALTGVVAAVCASSDFTVKARALTTVGFPKVSKTFSLDIEPVF
jgi:hypothetical protein